MFDYYIHVQRLKEEELVAEIEKLTKQLMTMYAASPMYQQVLDMLHTAQEAYQEKQVLARAKDLKDEVIEIGTIRSEVEHPDYSKEELLNITVEQYRGEPKE